MAKKKKKLLDAVENDKDTIVVDAGDQAMEDALTEIPEEEAVEDLLEELPEVKEVEGSLTDLQEAGKAEAAYSAAAARKPASRGLYAILSVLAPLAGTVTALVLAICFGVANLIDAGRYSPEEKEFLGPFDWAVKFTDQHSQADFVTTNVTFAIIMGLVFLAALVGLCVMTGRFRRDENGRIMLNWFDRLWSELHIAAGACAAVAAVFTAGPVARMVSCDNKFGLVDLSGVYKPVVPDSYLYGVSNNSTFWYCTIGIFALIAIAVICWVTLVKKVKARELIHCSLLGKILALLGIGAVHAGQGVAAAGKGIAKAGKGLAARNRSAVRKMTVPSDEDRRAARKLILKYMALAVVLIGFPVLFVCFTGSYMGMLFWTIISMIIALVVIARKVGKLTEIRAGVIEVKSGNLAHKITVDVDADGPKTDLDQLASDINHISEATNAAVQNEIKNQRLKTDLISNVSHDLKTPLTSMISYLDILDKEGLDAPDAPAHLAIVREKTDRLKTLTEELFEAAKASSGNIPCEIETIDLAALIDQSLAEMGDRLSRRNLDVRKKIRTDNTMVRADGKLLYRVLENLLGNISKYALEGSRVYIDVSKPTAPGKILMEIKNISRDELNISPDELMERFTRGDQSRNTEGSGLGLAIAKDLTNLMGGIFEIKIDGDMFKVSIMLNEA